MSSRFSISISNRESSAKMLISFVVSFSGHQEKLQRCLQSLRNQNSPSCETEILTLKGDFPPRLEGYRQARGSWVFFLDEDTQVLEAPWLSELAHLLSANPHVPVIGGAYRNGSVHYVARGYNLICNNWVRAGLGAPAGHDLRSTQNLLGGAFVLNKKLLQDSILDIEASFWGGEDTYFIRQLQKRGLNTFYSSKLDVFHWPSSSLRHLVSRALLHGRRRQSLHLRTEKLRWKALLEPQAFIYFPILILHQLAVEIGSVLG